MKKILYILQLILLPITVNSQTEKQLVPSDVKQLTVVTEPSTLYKGFFRPGLNMSYGVINKTFNTSGKRDYISSNGFGTNSSYHLSLQYGITDRLQVNLSIPYINTKMLGQYLLYAPAADTTLNGSIKVKSIGLGDVNAELKYQVISNTENKTFLTAHLYFIIPTGEKNPTNIVQHLIYNSSTGNGSLSAGLDMTYRKIIYPYSYSFYFGYKYSFPGSKIMKANDTQEKEFNDGDIIRTGASVNFHLNEWIALTNDISFLYSMLDKVENKVPDDTYAPWSLAYEPHLVFQIKRFRLAEAIIIPIIGKNYASADPQYILIAQYTF